MAMAFSVFIRDPLFQTSWAHFLYKCNENSAAIIHNRKASFAVLLMFIGHTS